MPRFAVVLIAAAALAPTLAPLQAQAQAQAQVQQAQTNGYGGGRTSDYTYADPAMNYCAALADLYVRYVGRSESGPSSNRRPDVNGGVAQAKCHSGDTAAAIPILEQKLIDAKVTLPARP